jgi:predicted XRE-type DNA-binding protein
MFEDSGHASSKEQIECLVHGKANAVSGERFRKTATTQHLAIDQYAVAVENDEIGQVPHAQYEHILRKWAIILLCSPGTANQTDFAVPAPRKVQPDSVDFLYTRSVDASPHRLISEATKKRFANVWDAIEDTPAQAENRKLRSALMMALKDHIARTGLSQSEAAKLLGVTQPRISDLMRGKIELFGLDTLVNMIGAARLHVEMRISDAA